MRHVNNMRQDHFRQHVADALLAAGLQPYQTRPATAGRVISTPGWHVAHQTRREVLLEYKTDVRTQPAGTILQCVERWHRALDNAGLTCRYNTDRTGVIVTDKTAPATVPYTPPPPAPVDVEAYRLEMLVNLAVELSAGVGEHARRYEYLNSEGREQYRRRVQTILTAPAETLHMWRQRGIG